MMGEIEQQFPVLVVYLGPHRDLDYKALSLFAVPIVSGAMPSSTRLQVLFIAKAHQSVELGCAVQVDAAAVASIPSTRATARSEFFATEG